MKVAEGMSQGAVAEDGRAQAQMGLLEIGGLGETVLVMVGGRSLDQLS